MIDQELFILFNRYGRLVRRNLVKPLSCSKGHAYGTALSPDDELLLVCHFCDTATVPGINTIDNVRAVVKEHFNE